MFECTNGQYLGKTLITVTTKFKFNVNVKDSLSRKDKWCRKLTDNWKLIHVDWKLSQLIVLTFRFLLHVFLWQKEISNLNMHELIRSESWFLFCIFLLMSARTRNSFESTLLKIQFHVIIMKGCQTSCHNNERISD